MSILSRPAQQSFDGQRVTNSRGVRAYLPQFSQGTFNDLADVLLCFPNGFSLEVVGKTVSRFDISRLGENLLGREDHRRGEIGSVSALVKHLPENCVNQVERVLDGGEPAGTVHDLPFVIVILPIDEAYSRFPEIAPSSAKDGQQ
ncbi:hypothetical protein [Aquamicrobium defluvii]|uniref:Uncharacterized protein n=1 Tax=Aquamicrobium defluvii TaxID=69279 RepID=A0A4R6YEX0_9HYPH|nr:hypothetical protein [Aquamicrobium defluvii]TDR34695.1 hypothetical protein DES43_113126 [Aquamicrobium defluvii]